MCGLAGYWGFGGLRSNDLINVASKMCMAIEHRGPDDTGFWHEKALGLVFGHKRLAIQDLSAAGHQPMVSNSQRFVIIFNGEIYNHLELRSELLKQANLKNSKSHVWKGFSDTETLLTAFDSWGVKKTLKKLVGMFALALWDRREKSLFLACDRMGEKPLYFGWKKKIFLFGSELKSIKQHPSFDNQINRDALPLYFRFNYIPAPYTIYKDIFKLKPGTFIRISIEDMKTQVIKTQEYWSLEKEAIKGQEQPFLGSQTETVEHLERLLRNSVKGQMIADVPLGAFLSGGIDSSTIVALMQDQSIKPIKTFSIGFNEKEFNEAIYSKEVAKLLGTDHTELYLSANDALNILPKLPELYDEPFSDPSQLPTFLVSQLTSEYVKVALSGDGGDELFGGYNRYTFAFNLWNKLARIPAPIRKLLGLSISSIPPSYLNSIINPFKNIIPNKFRLNNPGDKLHKGVRVLKSNSLNQVYSALTSHWEDPSSLVIDASEPKHETFMSKSIGCFSDIESMMLLDMMTYLPYDILVKVDRAAMGVSLETRVPFLDHRIVQFALSLPMKWKIREGKGKWVLRKLLSKYLPQDLIDRPKMGFGVPIDYWLRGELKDWARDLMNPEKLKNEGFLESDLIQIKLSEHISGKRNWQYQLWSILMFQAWLEKNEINS